MSDVADSTARTDADVTRRHTWYGVISMVLIAGGALALLAMLWPSDECLAKRAACGDLPVEVLDAERALREAQAKLQDAKIKLADEAAKVAPATPAQSFLNAVKNEGANVLQLQANYQQAVQKWAGQLNGVGRLVFDQRLLVLMFLLGMIGGTLHGLYSWVVHAGVGNLKTSWVPWLVARPIVGGLLALVVYVVLRGGLVTQLPTAADTAQPFNFYGFAALAILSGLFTHQAMEKLKEIFGVVFKSAQLERVARGPLVRKITPETLSPIELAAGGATIRLEGEGFSDKSVVKVAGKDVEIVKQTAILLEIKLPKIDGQKDGGPPLDIVVEEPTLKPRSDPAKLAVKMPPPAPPPPSAATITAPVSLVRTDVTDPALRPKTIAFVGANLTNVRTVKVNGQNLTAANVTATGFSIVLTAEVAAPAAGSAEMVFEIKNAAGDTLMEHRARLTS